MDYMQQTFVVVPAAAWGERFHCQLLPKGSSLKGRFRNSYKQSRLPILSEKCFRLRQKTSALRIPLSLTCRLHYGWTYNGSKSNRCCIIAVPCSLSLVLL